MRRPGAERRSARGPLCRVVGALRSAAARLKARSHQCDHWGASACHTRERTRPAPARLSPRPHPFGQPPRARSHRAIPMASELIFFGQGGELFMGDSSDPSAEERIKSLIGEGSSGLSRRRLVRRPLGSYTPQPLVFASEVSGPPTPRDSARVLPASPVLSSPTQFAPTRSAIARAAARRREPTRSPTSSPTSPPRARSVAL